MCQCLGVSAVIPTGVELEPDKLGKVERVKFFQLPGLPFYTLI